MYQVQRADKDTVIVSNLGDAMLLARAHPRARVSKLQTLPEPYPYVSWPAHMAITAVEFLRVGLTLADYTMRRKFLGLSKMDFKIYQEENAKPRPSRYAPMNL